MDEDGAAAAIAFSSEERYLPPMMGLPREVKIRAAILPACSRMVVKCSEWLRPVPRPDNRGKSALGRYSAITYNATTARRYRDFSSKPTTRIDFHSFYHRTFISTRVHNNGGEHNVEP